MEPVDLKDYSIQYLIGEGGFAKVYLGISKITNIKVAIKVIPKVMENEKNHLYYVKNEIDILKKIKYPFICRLFDVFESNSSIYLIMEYAQNGTMLDFLNKNGPFSEKQAVSIFAQLVLALKFLHQDCKIVHRDLKLENILLDINYYLRLIDFGFSKALSKDDLMKTRCGSLLYCAPELLHGMEYSFSVDIWSAGIILFVLVAGFFPFDDKNVTVLAQKIVYSDVTFPAHFSDNLEDLLRNMLTKDPFDRITIDEIIEHPWVRDEYLRLLGKFSKVKIDDTLVYDEIRKWRNVGVDHNDNAFTNIIESCLITEQLFIHLSDRKKNISNHKSYPAICKPVFMSDITTVGDKQRYRPVCITLPVKKKGQRRTPNVVKYYNLPST